MFWVGRGTSSVLVYELLKLINNSTCMGVDFLNQKKKAWGLFNLVDETVRMIDSKFQNGMKAMACV